MFVEMLKNAFKPNDAARSHTLLQKGAVVEVTDDEGQVLVEKGYAAELKISKKSEAPSEIEKASKKKKAEVSPAA